MTEPAVSRTEAIGAIAGRLAWPCAFVLVAAMTFSFLHARQAPSPPASGAVEHEGPTVVKDLRALARLETLSLHLEKVIDVKDHQQHLRGLVEADDAVLFVASGETILGVDLAKLGDDDARFDPATKTLTVTLPEPEVLATRLDEGHSYVYARSTDLLARRNSALEGTARQAAVDAFEKAAHDPANLARAREHAEALLRALGTRWGAARVIVGWQTPKGEVSTVP